jgi:predicted small secreted protein
MARKTLILIMLSTLFISGCGCIGGFGRDLQTAGSWLERTAD